VESIDEYPYSQGNQIMKLIFSGIDGTLFNSLAFYEKVDASWLSIEELMSTEHEIDNNDTRFVLFYSSPEVFLSTLGHKAINHLDQAEQQWLPQTELFIQFYLEHKANAILVDSEQCERNTDAFRALIDQKFDINSELSINSDNNFQQIDDSKKLLEQSLQLTLLVALSEHYDIQNTFENVISAADLLVECDDYAPEERISTLHDNCQSIVDVNNGKHSEYVDIVKENDQLLLQVQQLKKELKVICAQGDTNLEQLMLNKEVTKKTLVELSEFQENNNQISQEKVILENSITELTSENELSLLQVQQLQEELEATYKQHKILAEKFKLNLDENEKAVDTLSSFEVSNKQLAEEKTILENNITELTSENELSLLQVQQLQEELEATYKQHKILAEKFKLDLDENEKTVDTLSSFEVSNKQLAQEKTILENNIRELTSENELSLLQVQKLQAELEATYNQLTQEKTIFESNLRELTSDNELSLLQVQQLQEELEVLFLDNKELKQIEKKLTKQNNSEIDKERLLDLKADNEIALLQIQQLQEELEFYFTKYKSLSTNNYITNITPIKVVGKRLEKSLILAKLLST